MYNLMTKDQTLSCLLLSLLDSDCLNKLIRTRSDELIEPPKQDPSNQSNLLNLFYRSEHQHTNYRFIYHNHTIKVDKVEPNEVLKANNYEHENTNFSELKEGKYHLEKGSIIWKFRMEELEKVSMNSKRSGSDAESELRDNLLKDLDEKESKDLDAELMIKDLKKILSKWKSDDMSLEVLERLEKKKKSTEQEDKIQLIEKLINELKSNEKKQKIKIDLENYFIRKIKQINKKGSFDEGIKQSLVEKVIDPIQEKIIKYLNEDDYLRRFVIELQNDAKDIIKTIGGIFKEKHIEDLHKLKDDYYDENKRVVSELLKIRDLIKRSYIIEINKIIETNPDKDKRNEKINDLGKKFIKEIEVTKIKLFVKKLLIKTKRSEKDFSTNVELLTDDEIECILESMIEEVEHYNGITLNKTNDGIKELVKKIDKQKERNTNEHEGVPRDHIDQIEQNFDIKELVKNLTKIIIKIGIIVNKPKTNRFRNLFQTTSQLKEYIEGNKFEDLKEENLSNINEKFNKFEILIEKLVKDYTKEIDKIESNKSGKNILEDILAGERENGIIIDKVEKAMIKESAKMFIEENVKIRINRAKETFIKSIETASEEQQESQKSKIKESVNKFIEFVEELDKIEDINEIEEEVKNFITNNFIEENATTDGTEENNLKNATEIKNSVDEFIKWVNKKERITKFKKLENLIREIGITEIEKLGEDSIKPADDFIDHIETKIEELESDSKPEDIINNIRKFKIEKLANINEHERNEIINNIVICKINDELVKDSTERISTFKKLENENSEWRKELKENFIKRKNKIEELAEDPKKFEFQITDSLKADRDLVRLFCDLNEESIDILMGQMINNDEIAILTKIGFFIFRLNKDVRLNSKDRELISLNYFYYVHDPEQSIKKVQKMISNPKVDKDARHCCGKFLNMTKKVIYVVFAKEAKENDEINCNKLIRGWVSYVKNNNEDFLKYDNALLIFAIEANDLELINNIYKKCLDLFNQDPENNKAFLSIITKSMELLNKYYPEYVTKFSSDTNMIIDSPNYKIVPLRTSHLYSFSNIEIVDLSRSIFWTKCIQQISNIYNHTDKTVIRVLVLIIFGIFECLIFFLTFPISFPIFYILSYFNIINEIITDGFTEIYYRYYYYISKRINSIFSDEKPKPTITFIVPYIKFVSYPHEYDWWKELIKPKPSPFVKTINRSIYKTWNGEALINFKWNLYGKYYYFGIWILFTALLGCFTAATTLTRELIPDNIRERLLIASIILGFIHFIFEFRQFIYDPIEWILDPWNYFDFKFLLFFRALESFGVYFVIIISVAKKISSFLIVLIIIIVSFAHAFFILLKPRDIYSLTEQPPADNDDPNNPWKLEDKPNNNTNLFTNYGTSLFSMYLYLIGDLNSLSKWEYGNNPPLAGLMVLFSLLIAIYLMNLLIGLLSNAIEQDNNRASYFMQKAEIMSDIELFYLFPNQRRWKTWFPDVIYYHANFDETRRKVLEQIKNDEWNNDEFPEMKRKLLNKLKIHKKSNNL
ncbi:hypothetical protein RhiirB3_484012 [Rhizophagus irregularis]|nr:hypothetical protein RhiirB3_484012 [Rhizophagus irregularis]